MKVLFSKPDALSVFRMNAGLRERKWAKRLLRSRTEIDLGLLYVATFLDKYGHETKICETQIYRNGNKHFEEELKEFKPDIVGLSAITGVVKDAGKMAEVVKKYTDAVVVLGGHHASALPIMTLEEFPAIDITVVGEGEYTMAEVVTALEGKREMASVAGAAWRNGKNIKYNAPRPPISDLDSLPFPDRTKVKNHLYLPNLNDYVSLPSTNISSSRGCPFRCTFCSRTGARLLQTINLRSAENVFEEIVLCVEKFGIHDIRFPDDTFTFSRKRTIQICEMLLRHKIKINWSCYSCPNEVDPELLKLMRRSGCYLIKYGIETSDDSVLQAMKKGFTIQDARQAVKWTKEAQIECFSGWIIGLPGQTEEDIDRVIDFAIKISPDISVFASLAMFPGSSLFDEYRKENKLLHFDWDRYLDTGTDVFKGELSGPILEQKVRKAFRRFYLRPSYVFQKLIRIFVSGHPIREIRNIVFGFIDLF